MGRFLQYRHSYLLANYFWKRLALSGPKDKKNRLHCDNRIDLNPDSMSLAQVGDVLDVTDVIAPLPGVSSPLFLIRLGIEAVA